MKKLTDDEILAKMRELWPDVDEEDSGWGNRKNGIKVAREGDTVKLSVSQMYEAPGLTFAQLSALSDLFGSKNIHDYSISEGGCETCDYGSRYGFELTVRPESSSEHAGDEMNATIEYVKPKADDFYTRHMVRYPEHVNRVSWSSIKVLEFLNGRKWDDIALAYVHGLRPSAIRVVEGEETCDSIVWRVTVYVSAGIITGMRQEIEVWLPDGVANGHDLSERIRFADDD